MARREATDLRFRAVIHLTVKENVLSEKVAAHSGKTNRKRIDSLDVARAVLCLAVMFIHVNPLPQSLESARFPVTRLAVPLFFLISGYLFFRKYDRTGDAAQRKVMFRRFAVRYLLMYLGWFLILLYPTLLLRPWYDKGLIGGTLDMLNAFFFGSTFVASWYLTATVFGMFFLLILEKFLPERVVLALGTFLYLNACLYTNYLNLGQGGPLSIVVSFWSRIRINPAMSFVTGFFWLSVSHFVTRRLDAIYAWVEKYHALAIFVFIGAVLLYFEKAGISALQLGGYSNDCYLFLPPLAVLLFISILTVDVTCRAAPSLRSWSSITYPLHGTLGFVVPRIAEAHSYPLANWMRFSIVFACCTIVSWAIVALSKRKPFGFLRWLY